MQNKREHVPRVEIAAETRLKQVAVDDASGVAAVAVAALGDAERLELAAPVAVDIGPNPGGYRGCPRPTLAHSPSPEISSYADPVLAGVFSIAAAGIN